MLGFTDIYGQEGDVGHVVGYAEEFANMPTYTEKLYVVVDCPNYGHMVVMTEIADYDWNPTTKTYTCTKVDESVQITVEPYKVVLI